jgi:hypothetical protein
VKRKLFRRALILAVCLGLAIQTPPSKAETLKTIGDQIVIGIVVASVAIVVAVVLVVRHEASYKGCVSSSPDGLEFTSQDGQPTYRLSGDTTTLRPGELVRLKGKKKSAKSSGGNRPTLIVTRIGKDYGACPAHP